jgi:hypothetical protein
MGRNVRVGSGNGHFFAEGLVHCHLVLTGRDNPAQRGHNGNQKKRMV